MSDPIAPCTAAGRPARSIEERCQVQDCPNRHEWFYGPGLYLCNKHILAIEAEAAGAALSSAATEPAA